MKKKTLLFIVNVSSFFISHRLPIALAAQEKGYHVILASGDKDNSALLKSHGIEHHHLRLSRSSTSLRAELSLCLDIYRLLKNTKPDIIHNVTIKPVLYASLINRLFIKMPCVNAIPGLGFSFIQKGFKARLFQSFLLRFYRFALNAKRTKTIFQNSDDLQFFLEKRVLIKANTSLIKGAGVCLKQYTAYKEPEDGPVKVLLPARLLWDKGVGEFIEAAKVLAPITHAKFILAGDIDLDNPSSVDADTLNSWHDLPFLDCLGYQADMTTHYKNSHIVCLPSYREGMPRALLEAQASGRPVVTTNVPGCREVIADGVSGILVPSHTVSALADAIKQLIENQALRVEMGKMARVRAEQFFSVEVVVEKTLSLYDELL